MIDETIPAGDGIYGQMQNTENPTETTNQMPSLEDFREMMTILSNNAENRQPDMFYRGVTKTPMDGINLKIKEGYLYMIGSIVTGSGGAMNYVDICRNDGMSDELIGEYIFVTEAEGIVSGQVWTCLNKIEWHKKETDDNKG